MYLKFFKSKKASTLELMGITLIELIMLLAFIMIALKLIDDFAESTTYEKAFLSRHFATLVDVIEAPKGDVMLSNTIDTKWFTYKIDAEEVQVYDESLREDPPTRERSVFPLITDTNLRFDAGVLKPANKVVPGTNYNPLKWFYTTKQESDKATSVNVALCKKDSRIIVGDCGS